jgi:hypothetical protein
VTTVASRAHDGDNLFDCGRVGGIANALVARRTAGAESRHRRRRATASSSVEQQLGHDASSGSDSSSEHRSGYAEAHDRSVVSLRYRFIDQQQR